MYSPVVRDLKVTSVVPKIVLPQGFVSRVASFKAEAGLSHELLLGDFDA
jgi:hypothetical protein